MLLPAFLDKSRFSYISGAKVWSNTCSRFHGQTWNFELSTRDKRKLHMSFWNVRSSKVRKFVCEMLELYLFFSSPKIRLT